MSKNAELTTAVHALCWLELASRRGRTSLTSAEIAASLANHPVQIRRTLAPLRRAGLVRVVGRGPGAGWTLARPAHAITLQDISTTLGEEEPFGLHPHQPNQECPVGAGIRPVLEDIYANVRAAMARQLERRTVADVLEAILSGGGDPSAGSPSLTENEEPPERTGAVGLLPGARTDAGRGGGGAGRQGPGRARPPSEAAEAVGSALAAQDPGRRHR